MDELMTAKGWSVGEMARIAGVSSSAVSQWIGNGKGKQSKTIGNIQAAMKLEKASGFSALWLAQGKGPKLAPSPQPQEAQSEAADLENALEVLTESLLKADENARLSLEPLLASMAREPQKAKSKVPYILRLLVTGDDIRSAAHHDQPGHVSGDLGILDLGGHQNGRSDRAARPAKGGSK